MWAGVTGRCHDRCGARCGRRRRAACRMTRGLVWAMWAPKVRWKKHVARHEPTALKKAERSTLGSSFGGDLPAVVARKTVANLSRYLGLAQRWPFVSAGRFL